jgi:methionyl-tRNA synthetase
MDAFMLHEGAFAAFDIIDAANEYIAETEPWTLARQGQQQRLAEVLSDVAETVRIAAVLLLPVMPRSCAEILRRFGETRDARTLRLDADARWTTGVVRTIHRAEQLWPRLEAPATGGETARTGRKEGTMNGGADTARAAVPEAGVSVEPQAAPLAGPATADAVRPAEPQAAPAASQEKISIDEFGRLDLRVARVVAAEKVKGSRKLIKMQIDLGTESRTIVAGIAEAYQPESLVGRSIVVVANLKPAKLMGIESNGMVLAASPEDGPPALLGFENPPPPGSRVK